ncbi:MAG: hypothetical protein Q9226_004038 [Calogaya cf. arnoldii]
MSGSSTLDVQPKDNSTVGMFERKGVFPFISLPQELRQMIYELALTLEYIVGYRSIPAVTLLYTCKQVYHEANVVLYAHNTFTTLCQPTGQQTDDLLDVLAKQKGLTEQGWSLDRIGPSNAAKIERLELTFGALPEAADIFPLFAEIIRQHIKRLRRLVIDFDNVNDYGSTFEFEERNEYQAAHAIAFFTKLRSLVKHLPHLRRIKMFSCADEMRAMAAALLKEKRTGVTVDLKKKWDTLFEKAKARLLAIPESQCLLRGVSFQRLHIFAQLGEMY